MSTAEDRRADALDEARIIMHGEDVDAHGQPIVELTDVELAAQRLVAISQWVDDWNGWRSEEARLWGRVAKVCEEAGETMQAMVGLTGQNPRKGSYVSFPELVDELLDVAVTALGAVEHVNGNDGSSIEMMFEKIERTAERAAQNGGGVSP
jgi:hypothetical protein